MTEELNERQKNLKQRFTKERGYWSEKIWGSVIKLDPGFFEEFLDFSAFPWKHGVLPPKVKELIYIAIDASVTHMYEPGLRQHIANALKLGATKEEIMEVLELVSVLGMHACILGAPVLMEELKESEKSVGGR